MKKRKLYFGTRRRWPDSPRQQKLQVTYDIEVYNHWGNENSVILEYMQNFETDLYKGLASLAFSKEQLLNGGFKRGEFTFFSTAGYNPKHNNFITQRLRELCDNGLQGKGMICLEDSYVTPHDQPYNISLESPYAYLRAPNG